MTDGRIRNRTLAYRKNCKTIVTFLDVILGHPSGEIFLVRNDGRHRVRVLLTNFVLKISKTSYFVMAELHFD